MAQYLALAPDGLRHHTFWEWHNTLQWLQRESVILHLGNTVSVTAQYFTLATVGPRSLCIPAMAQNVTFASDEHRPHTSLWCHCFSYWKLETIVICLGNGSIPRIDTRRTLFAMRLGNSSIPSIDNRLIATPCVTTMDEQSLNAVEFSKYMASLKVLRNG